MAQNNVHEGVQVHSSIIAQHKERRHISFSPLDLLQFEGWQVKFMA